MKPPVVEEDSDFSDPLVGHPQFRFIRLLGVGSQGVVAHYIFTENGEEEEVACKFLHRHVVDDKYVKYEVINHSNLKHPNVIEFKRVFLTSDKTLCLVLHYANGGNLLEYLIKMGSLSEHQARWFFQHISIGLDYCHRKGVVVRDIKLENCLLESHPSLPLPIPKLGDFGLSKDEQRESIAKTKVGTLAYVAPEIIRSTTTYDARKSDIWSLGVILFCSIFGCYPFDAPPITAYAAGRLGGDIKTHRVQMMMESILLLKWSIPQEAWGVSPWCRDLLERLLHPDPVQRISMAEIQQHPYFLENLPPRAVEINDDCLYTKVLTAQSSAEIDALIKAALAV